MSLKGENGRAVKLIQGFSASSHNEFMVLARKVNLVNCLASAFCGDGMSEDDVINSLEVVLTNHSKKKITSPKRLFAL